MKNVVFGILALFALGSAAHADYGFKRQPFTEVIYLGAVTATQSALNSGKDAASPKGLVDGDLWAIPAGVVIENVYMVVDTAITGLTVLEVGDDDSASGFITDSISVNSGAGVQFYALSWKGSYLRFQGANAPSALVKQAKYYSASGKEIKLNVTGTALTGAARLVIEGYKL